MANTILAFDTSANHCAVSVAVDGVLKAHQFETRNRGQAEFLFPMIEATLLEAKTDLSHVTAIGVGVGPGNFTGIRVAVSAARGLALGANIPAIGSSNFELLARSAENGKCLVSLQTLREKAYGQIFENGQATSKPFEFDPNDFRAADLPDCDHVLGHSAARIGEALGCKFSEVELSDIAPTIAVATLEKLKAQSAFSAPSPLYIRPADAAPSSDPKIKILS